MFNYKEEHNAHCREIVETMEKYADGRFYRCPDCGEIVEDNNMFCPCCGMAVDLVESYDWEQLTLYDYFVDALDIEYRVDSKHDFKTVKVLLAFGGPNIYLDTATRRVELYWWTERGYAEIPSAVCDNIDELFEDIFNN